MQGGLKKTLVVLIVGLMALPVSAAYISSIQVNLYNSSPRPRIFMGNSFRVANNDGTAVVLSGDKGDLKVNDNPTFEYDLFDMTYTMDALSTLSSDISGTSKVAKGYFNNGAHVTIAGTVKNKAGVSLYTGSLIEAVITQDEFYVFEQAVPNTLWTSHNMQVTGGEFLTGAHTGLKFYDPAHFGATYTLAGCSQDGKTGVENFQSAIYLGTGSRVQFVIPIPEPLTVVLLGLGAMGAIRRRK